MSILKTIEQLEKTEWEKSYVTHIKAQITDYNFNAL